MGQLEIIRPGVGYLHNPYLSRVGAAPLMQYQHQYQVGAASLTQQTLDGRFHREKLTQEERDALGIK